MPPSCTMFSVTDAELHASSDGSSDEERTDVIQNFSAPQTLDLSTRWMALHAVLGNHGADHPLGFLQGGGDRFAALDDGARSSARYFKPAAVANIRAALERVAEMYMHADVRIDFDRLRAFFRQVADAKRGFVVHLLN